MSEKKKRKRNPHQTQWSRNWNEEHLSRLYITVPKAQKQRIEAHARRTDGSINALVNRLLQRELALSEEEWKHPETIKKQET